VDRQGQTLYNTPIWMDTRTADIAQELTDRVGFDRIFAVSGNPLEPTYSTAKMVWFRRNRPDVYANTFKFMQSNSYIVLKLTGRFTMDLSQGYGVHSFDMRRGCWDEKLTQELGLDGEKLPELFPCHEVVGAVTKEAAEATGLAAGTPVVAGGLDACCGTLGAGVHLPGQTQEQGGMAGGMSICVDRALAHPKLILSFHVVPGVWLLQGGSVGGGGTLKWFRQELGAFEEAEASITGRSAFEIMSEEADTIGTGADGLVFLPYMAGERSPLWDRHAKGVFFGLGFEKTRSHMIRSVMEGVAFSLEHNLRTAYEADVSVDSLNAMGGSANSRVWTQIKSDVTGKPIRVPASDTASTLGAALLAGVGTGLYKDFNEAVTRTVRIVRTHEPDMERHNAYMKYFDVYIELYKKLKDTMRTVDGLR
jgi:xylulokinase